MTRIEFQELHGCNVDQIVWITAKRSLRQYGFENDSVPLQIEIDLLAKAKERFESAGYKIQQR